MSAMEEQLSNEEQCYGRLVSKCIDAACKSKETVDIWRRQKRTLEKMPNHLLGPLFQHLLKKRLLFPSLLEIFKHSLEEVNLKGESFVDIEWMVYLGGYQHLRVLSLADCKGIRDSALWNLSGLTYLEELDLSRCSRVTNAGLEHLLSLSRLKRLSISETKVNAHGVARLSSLSLLTSLDLGGLPVENTTISSLQELKLLEQLDVWGSQITNDGASLLRNFVNLNQLNLAWTHVTHVPVVLSLRSLNMSQCVIESYSRSGGVQAPLEKLYFSGATFKNINDVRCLLFYPNLTLLDLSHSSVDNVSFIASMNYLEILDLSFTGVTDSSINVLAEMGRNLKMLNLSSTRINSNGIAHLVGHVNKLENISLSHTDVDDYVVTYLAHFPALRSINLSNTNIKSELLLLIQIWYINITSMVLIILLYLGFFNVGNSEENQEFSLSYLKVLDNLENLEVQNTKISDSALEPLPLLRQLQYLSLRSDYLTDLSLHMHASLPKLKHLRFQGAVVTDSGLCSFVPPQSLQLLDISDCWLLSCGALLQFHKLYPHLLLRHESLLAVANDHTYQEYDTKNTCEYERASTCRKGKKLESAYLPHKSYRNRIENKVMDERIKYSISELLELRDAAHSLSRLTVVDPSLSAILINSEGKNAM